MYRTSWLLIQLQDRDPFASSINFKAAARLIGEQEMVKWPVLFIVRCRMGYDKTFYGDDWERHPLW